MTARLVTPSPSRLLCSIACAAVLSCVLAGVCLFVEALVTSRDDSTSTTAGDYVRLFVVFVLLYGPALLLVVWWISIPVIVATGALVACVRRGHAAGR